MVHKAVCPAHRTDLELIDSIHFEEVRIAGGGIGAKCTIFCLFLRHSLMFEAENLTQIGLFRVMSQFSVEWGRVPNGVLQRLDGCGRLA